MSKEGDSEVDVDILSKNKKIHRVRYFQLLKYASTYEILLFAIGIISSAAIGASTPVSFLFFSDLVNDFMSPGSFGFSVIIERMAYLGAATFVVAYIQMLCLQYCARRQVRRIRCLFFSSILRQDAAWFDSASVGALITQLTEGVDKIEAGIGEKAGMFIQHLSVFVAGIVISLAKDWELTLVSLATFPPVVVAFASVGFVVRKLSAQERAAYSRANGIAGEVLAAVKTIFAFEGQSRECKRYSVELAEAEKVGIKRSTIFGFVLGTTDASIYVLMAVTFFYGILLIDRQTSDPGEVILVVLSMLFGGATVGQALQQYDHFNFATTAAGEIFPIIDRIPPIDKKMNDDKVRLTSFQHEIVFDNVSFTYPSRPDFLVLDRFSWSLKRGQNLAVVGSSGSGKSTLIQLLQRLYDPDSGRITVDGIDLRDLDLSWWRSCLGVVSQEPTLFAGSLKENICLAKPDATLEEVEAAAELAHAHGFISKLPDAYDTIFVSQDGGGGMSGGQKQRVAIARALIRNPKVLLLDEATSALDTRSEKAVQAALNDAKKGRTTVTVAHRLSTVRDADVILVMERGRLVEAGSHAELMKRDGVYANLARHGLKAKDDDSDNEDLGDDDNIGNILRSVQQIREKGDIKVIDNDDEKTITSMSTESVFDVLPKKKSSTLVELVRLNKPEKWYLLLGCVTSALIGGSQAAFVVVYTEMYSIFPLTDSQERSYRTAVLCGIFGAMAAFRLIIFSLNGYAFGVAGGRLTTRCRELLFGAFLKQDVEWFDRSENQPGALTGRLAADVPMLQNATGRRLASMIEMFVLIVASLFIGFYYSWKIALAALAFFPVLVVASAFEMRHWSAELTRKSVKGAALAQEVFTAAKTVTALQAEEQFALSYAKQAVLSQRQIIKGVLRYALVNAIANSMMSFEFCGAFYLGGILIENGELDIMQLFRSFFAITFAASNLGFAASLLPDAKKASRAAKAIFEIIYNQPKLLPDEGDFPDWQITGNVAFENVHFCYPTRKKAPVLRGFTFNVPAGKSVALVGQSGCGKSTALQLIQRFYDPTKRGSDTKRNSEQKITLDNLDINTLAPDWIRRQIGVVSQEPNLMDLTIRENIAYGLNHLMKDSDDSASVVSMQQVIDAARQANAHSFITSLPEQYETRVGSRGSKLSGGQKQRIAIARALIRNPKLLLLDEATAALDNESERIVQAALDEAMKKGGRTCLVVAHRLTTVEVCDLIVVLERGRAVEWGSPQSLLETRGAFYSLYHAN